MFITTSGIVLRAYPFRDKKLIVKIFTKKAGLISCIITKNKSQIPLSQILTMAEITYKNSKKDSSRILHTACHHRGRRCFRQNGFYLFCNIETYIEYILATATKSFLLH